VLGRDQNTNTIDITWAEGPLNGKTQKGIYKIQKDALTLSRGADERPKGFTDAGKVGKPGRLTLERVKSEGRGTKGWLAGGRDLHAGEPGAPE
jgi:hypothetical protein